MCHLPACLYCLYCLQGHLLLSQAWFQPDKALSAGIEPLLRGYVASPRGQVGMPFAFAVQQNLFGPSHINGTDLLAINIQRGRDHGLPDYNTCRWGVCSYDAYVFCVFWLTLAAVSNGVTIAREWRC